MSVSPTEEGLTYSYRYDCKTWYGTTSGIRNVHTTGNLNDDEARNLAGNDARAATGYPECNAELLQRFYVTIRLDKAYPGLLQFPTS